MRVFTHFYEMDLPNGRTVGVRWRTILQFGDGWDVIGNVVMKNPGSARVRKGETSSITDIFLTQELRDFAPEDENPWYEFQPDATMHSIKDLFALKYGIDPKNLCGIIQIFNLFYIKNPDLNTAMDDDTDARFEICTRDLHHLSQHKDKPTYLGWGDLWSSDRYAEKAKAMFDLVQPYNNYLSSEIDKNPFIHPLYLMRYGRKLEACTNVINLFSSKS